MNRFAGIVVAALGLILAVLSIAKVVPGATGAGVFLILCGGLIIGLSFISKPETDGTERMSTASSLVNIFFSPGEVFGNFRRHPRFLVALLIMVILSASYSLLFANRLGAERIANFTIDKTLEMSFIANNEEARKQVESGRAQAILDAQSKLQRVIQLPAAFAGFTVISAILAAVFLLFALAMGGKMNFWQAYSVVIYAWFPVSVLRFVLNTIVLYIKDPTDIHPILGQQTLIQDSLNFLVSSAEHPVIYTLLGSFSLLMFYWVALNAIGLKNAGEKVTGTIAWTASISIFVVLLLFGLGMAIAFPSFIS
ncbi:MAG TPA: YIP1 family protein [Pyrinomonadaceae bacterium]|nr:YIP1 family protein [Acidobacteriota bacterium]HQZ98180.1 YIP1 family protein [Pyrinomonadaceae bacterium]